MIFGAFSRTPLNTENENVFSWKHFTMKQTEHKIGIECEVKIVCFGR